MPPKSATRPPSKPKIDTEQSRRFIETARALGCDEDASAADALMGQMARTPPQPKPKPGVKSKTSKAD